MRRRWFARGVGVVSGEMPHSRTGRKKGGGLWAVSSEKLVGRHLGLTRPKEKRLASEGKSPGRDSSRLQPPDQDLSPSSLSKTDAIFMGAPRVQRR